MAALISTFTRRTSTLDDTTNAIKKSMMSSVEIVRKINGVSVKKVKLTQSIAREEKKKYVRNLEVLARREQEDARQASKFTINKNPSPFIRLTTSNKGFLGRIMDFLSSLAVGWILQNLPQWLKWCEAFVKRVNDLWNSLRAFTSAVFGFVQGFGTTLANVIGNIASFQFDKLPGTVQEGMDELGKQFESMQEEFNKGFALFDKPLFDESELTEETAEPTSQEQSGVSVSPGSQGTGRTYYSQGGTKITDPGGKDYGTYIPGGRGSRGSSRVHGAGGQRGHTGEDYSMPIGTPLTMIAKGTVIDVETNAARGGGYGKFVVIQLDSGEYVKLAHLDSVNVRVGEKVGAGTGPGGTAKVIGFSGDTGLSSGPHLHLDYARSYDKGSAMVSGTMDPMSFINGGGLVKGQNVKSSGEVVEPKPAITPPTASGQPSQPQQTMMGQPAPSGGTLSTSQLVALAKQAGMTQNINVKGYSGPLSVLMGAVAMAESSGRSAVFRNDSQVYGLWQIQFPTHRAALAKIGITSAEQLKDPLTNAKAAKMVYDRQGITAWEAFTKGMHKKFLPEAQKAAGISPAQFTSAQQGNVPGSITPVNEGEVVFAEFPASGVSVAPGTDGSGAYGGGSSASPTPSLPLATSESEVLNNFIKKKLLVELSYL